MRLRIDLTLSTSLLFFSPCALLFSSSSLACFTALANDDWSSAASAAESPVSSRKFLPKFMAMWLRSFHITTWSFSSGICVRIAVAVFVSPSQISTPIAAPALSK